MAPTHHPLLPTPPVSRNQESFIDISTTRTFSFRRARAVVYSSFGAHTVTGSKRAIAFATSANTFWAGAAFSLQMSGLYASYAVQSTHLRETHPRLLVLVPLGRGLETIVASVSRKNRHDRTTILETAYTPSTFARTGDPNEAFWCILEPMGCGASKTEFQLSGIQKWEYTENGVKKTLTKDDLERLRKVGLSRCALNG